MCWYFMITTFVIIAAALIFIFLIPAASCFDASGSPQDSMDDNSDTVAASWTGLYGDSESCTS